MQQIINQYIDSGAGNADTIISSTGVKQHLIKQMFMVMKLSYLKLHLEIYKV